MNSESIQQFAEVQAFSRAFDLAPFSPPPTLSTVSKLDRQYTGRLRKRDTLLAERIGVWERGGRGAKSYDRK